MRRMSWEQDARDTLAAIDEKPPERITKDDFLLRGAALSILANGVHPHSPTFNIPVNEDAVNGNEINEKNRAKDELSGAEEYHRLRLFDISRDKLRHAEHWMAAAKKRGEDVSDLMLLHNALMAKLF